jgi:putative membrane protein
VGCRHTIEVMLAAVVSALHVLALAIGLPGVVLRGRALASVPDAPAVRRVLAADAVWGIAALLWLLTGLGRAFGGLEKGSAFYLQSPLFWTKMTLFGLILLLELLPMVTFVRWRRVLRRGQPVDTARVTALARLNTIEVILVIAMVFVASFMARGFGIG